MGYLIIAIIVSSAIVITFRLFTLFKIDNLQAITVNYVIASSFGALIYTGNTGIQDIWSLPWLPIALIIGLLFIVVFFIFALSAQKAGVAITAVSSKMSVIIPVIIGVVFYPDERMNLMKLLGIIFTLSAFYLIFMKEKQEKVRNIYFFLPLLLFLGNGTNDTLLNYCENNYIRDNNGVILLLNIIFTTALILGVIYLSIQFIRKKSRLHIKNIIAGIILGLLNFGSTYYVLKSLTQLQSSVFFPIFNLGIVGISVLFGFTVFKEKLRLLNWLGIIFAAIAITLIAYS